MAVELMVEARGAGMEVGTSSLVRAVDVSLVVHPADVHAETLYA